MGKLLKDFQFDATEMAKQIAKRELELLAEIANKGFKKELFGLTKDTGMKVRLEDDGPYFLIEPVREGFIVKKELGVFQLNQETK